MRPIDAQSLRYYANKEIPPETSLDFQRGWLCAVEYITEKVPTMDAEPVRHGRWIPVDSCSAYGGDEATWGAHGNPIAVYYCSECKEQSYADESGKSIISPYCPFCGARMDSD